MVYEKGNSPIYLAFKPWCLAPSEIELLRAFMRRFGQNLDRYLGCYEDLKVWNWSILEAAAFLKGNLAYKPTQTTLLKSNKNTQMIALS